MRTIAAMIAAASGGMSCFGGLMSFFMPGFHRHPATAAAIARVIAGYGELEFIMALCVGEALDDRNLALSVLFRLKSEAARIDLGAALAGPKIEKHKLKTVHDDALSAMRFCRVLRNQYAHSHWTDYPMEGLFFTNMEDDAHKGIFFGNWFSIDEALLEQQELYLEYTQHMWYYLTDQMKVLKGTYRASLRQSLQD
jgi:hypothetical protein